MTTEIPSAGFRAWLRKHGEILSIGAILLVALALRLYKLDNTSFWIDELAQLKQSRPPLLSVPRGTLQEASAVPVDYFITHFVYHYIGRSEAILRLPAVLWGVLSVGAIYVLGRRLFDRATGFLAAAMLAAMPIVVYYSREMRPYSLTVFVMLLLTLAFHRALTLGTKWCWALYGLTLAVGMYTHYYVAVAGILQGAYLVWMAISKRLPWKTLGPYVLAAGVAGLLFLPWVLADSFGSGYAFQWPSKSILAAASFVYRGGDNLLADVRPLTWFVGFAWASVGIGALMAIRGGSRERDYMGLLSLMSIGGLASVLALDYTGPYFFATRQFLPYTPLIVLLVSAASLAAARYLAQRAARMRTGGAFDALVVALLVVFAVVALSAPLSEVYRHKKQDWRGVSRYLLQHAWPEDAVLLRATFDIEYYAPELADQIEALRGMKTVREAAKTHPRVWIVDWSSALDRYVPDVGEWVESEKPLRITGFTGMELYLYSETLTSEELKD